MLGAMAAIALIGVPLASAENPSKPGQIPSQHVAMNHQLPGWAEKLKGQTIVEDAMSGRPERFAMVEQQHQRIMEHMAQDPQLQGVNTGMYYTSSMMHQYGAGSQDPLLVSDPRVEPVAMTGGGKCPATAPVKQYNISTINVEITLNQWLDFYPGYMYVLDEDVDKVRAEEAKNKEARDKEGFDPGAVIPGVQAQWIQPPSSAETRATVSKSSSQPSWKKVADRSACIFTGRAWLSVPPALQRRRPTPTL
jgi:hypothetical protein